MKRIENCRNDRTWLNVSDCKSSGAGIHVTQDKSSNSYTFGDIKELDRCYFVFKRDTGITSPYRNAKNVGAAHCLKYFFDNHPGYNSHSMGECIEKIKNMVKTQDAIKMRKLPKEHSTCDGTK